MNESPVNPEPVDEPEAVSTRREFLQSARGWSAIAAAAALGVGMTARPSSAWLNSWRGSGWVNWHNAAGTGWVNRWRGTSWLNR